MAKLNDLIVTIGAKTRSFDKALGSSMRKMQTFGKNTKQLGKSLSRNLTAPIAAIGGLAVKTAASFEFAMAKVKAVSGFTGAEIGKLRDQAKQLGATTSKSASEVAALQLELAKLGKTSTEIEGMTESVLSLGIAFDEDLGAVAETVGATLNEFGIDASETGRVADVMATAFGSSALDLENFRESMSKVGPIANEFGFSLEETTAVLGTLANSAISGADAGTKFKMALSELASEGDDVKETFVKLIKGKISYTEAMNVFGKRAAILGPILGKNGEKLAELQTKLENSEGAAISARKELEETAMGGFAALQSAVEAAAITLGEGLMPTINKAARFITDLASGIANMNNETRESVIKFAAIAAAIGPLLVVLPSIIGAIGMLISPVGLITAAIVGLGIAIVTFADEIAPYITDVINYFITLYNESTTVRNIIGGIKGTAIVVFDFLAFALDSVIEGFKDLGRVISAFLSGNIDEIPSIIGEAFTNSAERMAEFGTKAAEDWRTAVEDELQREKLELVTEESVADAASRLFGIMDLIPTFAMGGGGGAGIETPQVGGLLKKLGKGTTAPTVEGALNIVDIEMDEDIVEEEDINQVIAAADLVKRRTEAMAQSVSRFVEHAFNQIASGTQTFSEVMTDMLKNLVKQLAIMVAQFIILNTLFGGMGVGGMNLREFIRSGFGLPQGLPQFASGGIVSGPVIAQVGEYAGASHNPEVIAPLSKLQAMMGGQAVQVTGKISGRDILLTSERNSIDRNRVRGF